MPSYPTYPIVYRGSMPAALWASQNPTLAQFERGRESDTGKEKEGPGAWNSLEYSNPSGAPSLDDVVPVIPATEALAVAPTDDFYVYQADMVVTLAGTVAARGAYKYQGEHTSESGDESTRPFYSLVGANPLASSATWNGGSWVIFAANGDALYLSDDDVATPDLCTTWNTVDGIAPVPTVTASPVLKSVTKAVMDANLVQNTADDPETNRKISAPNGNIELFADTTVNITSSDGFNVNGQEITGGKGALLSCLVNNSVLATATGKVFTSPGNGGTPLSIASEGAVGWIAPRSGTLRNLFVRTGTTAKVNTPETIITIRKNGVDTTLTVTITQTVTTNSSDQAHAVNISEADVLTVSIETTGVAGVSTSIAGISFQFD